MSSGAIVLEDKASIKKRLGFSIDEADSCALCFSDGPPGVRIVPTLASNFNRPLHYPTVRF